MAAAAGYLTYACDVPGGHVSAAFPRVGPSWAAVTANVNRQEIGTYRRSLPDATVAQLAALLHQSRYRNLPAPPPMMPDTPTLAVGEADAGAALPKLASFLLRDVPAALIPYVHAAQAAVEEVRREPYRVVAGEVRLADRDHHPARPLSFEATIRNVGAEPLVIDNPLRAEAHDGLNLSLIVEGLDPAEPGALETPWLKVALDPRHVSPLPGQAAALETGGRIELAPGQGVCFWVRRRLWISPGNYRAAVVYACTNNTDDERTLEGELTMDGGTFAVRP